MYLDKVMSSFIFYLSFLDSICIQQTKLIYKFVDC